MFGFSSTKKRVEILENKLNLIETSLRVSFHNIKKDLSQTKYVQEVQIQRALRRLDILESQIFDLKDKNKEQDKAEKIFELGEEQELPLLEQKKEKPSVDSLTDVQQNMLLFITKLQVENPDQLLSAKRLAEELYPDKSYEKIRPMISTYLDVLEEFNLIRKERKRKQAFISLTEKGLSLVNPKIRQKIQIRKQKKQ